MYNGNLELSNIVDVWPIDSFAAEVAHFVIDESIKIYIVQCSKSIDLLRSNYMIEQT